jgi:hypothetical protein
MSAASPPSAESHQAERVNGERAVARAPMQVGACNSAGSAYQANLLPASDGVAGRDETFAEVEISGDDTTSVIDVQNVAGEKESIHQRDHAAVSREYRRADCALEIDAEVAARHPAVEYPPGTEAAGDA